MDSRKIVIAFCAVALVAAAAYEGNLLYKYYLRRQVKVLSLNESPSCSSAEKRPKRALSLMESAPRGSENIVAVDHEDCFRTGMSVPLSNRHVKIDPPAEIKKLRGDDALVVMNRLSRGKVTVVGVFSIDEKALALPTGTLASQLGLKGADQISEFLDKVHRTKLVPPINALRVTVEEAEAVDYSREAPYFGEVTGRMVYMDGSPAPFWGGVKLSAVAAQGALLIDVRSPAEFALGHHPGATNLPYVVKRPVDIPNAASFLPALGVDEFDLTKLPQAKDSLVVFIGSGLQDVRASRAQFQARIHGWNRATQLYGGERARNKLPLRTPEAAEGGVTRLEAHQALGMLESGKGILVDVRPMEEAQLRSIAGAFRLAGAPSFQQLPSTLLEDRSLAEAELAPVNTALFSEIPNGPDVAVIFFGSDDLDWRPLNFAKLQARLDSKRARYWLRDGLGGWLSSAVSEPLRYKTVTSSTAP